MCCIRIVNERYSRVLTKHSPSSAHDYRAHPYSNAQSSHESSAQDCTVHSVTQHTTFSTYQSIYIPKLQYQ